MAEKRTKTRKKIKLNKKLVCIIGILLFLVAVIFVNIIIFKPVNVGKINKEGKAEYIENRDQSYITVSVIESQLV